MADLFSFKKGARLPSRSLKLKSHASFDLAQASSITFVYRTKGVVERRTITVSVYGATSYDAEEKLYSASITVDFGDSDVATIAKYEWHVEAVFSGKTMCFPEKDFYTFSVTEPIAAP